MATKRTRKTRTPETLFTDEILHLYERGLELTKGRIRCIESNKICTHPACDEYNEVSRQLSHQLRLAPHLPSPLDEPDDWRGWEIVAPIKAALERAINKQQREQR